MNQEQVKASLLKHIQQEKQILLNSAVEKLKIPLIQLQSAAKALEEQKHITSEKTDKGKVIRLVDKSNVQPKLQAVSPPATDKPAEKPVKKKGRDTSKHVFEKSEPLSKGRCVLAILKAYIRDKKPTVKDLKATFNDEIVQRYGVTANLSDAKAMSSDGRNRYFLDQTDILVTKDGVKLACTNQWTTERFEALCKAARKVGYTVKVSA
jgi:hypothetical protein